MDTNKWSKFNKEEKNAFLEKIKETIEMLQRKAAMLESYDSNIDK